MSKPYLSYTEVKVSTCKRMHGKLVLQTLSQVAIVVMNMTKGPYILPSSNMLTSNLIHQKVCTVYYSCQCIPHITECSVHRCAVVNWT